MDNHPHHDAAETWFNAVDAPFATCPITQGSLVRLLLREGQTAASAAAFLKAVTAHNRHEFWQDSLSYNEISLNGVMGHRQVTDSYLTGLARDRHGRIATFDRGLVAMHPDVGDLVPALSVR